MFSEENDEAFEFHLHLEWEKEDLGFGLGPYDLRYYNEEQTLLVARDVIFPDKRYQVVIGEHQLEILYSQFREFITKYDCHLCFETFIIDLVHRKDMLKYYTK